jgi:hypothetical protein
LLLMVAYYRDQFMELGWGLDHQQHLPLLWLIGSGIALATGGGLLYLVGRSPRPTMPM